MTIFLDTQRLHAFAATAEAFEAGGMTIDSDPKEFRALANYINNATGRATVKNERITNFLMNMPLFAGRFYVSRVKHLATVTVGWAFLPPATRAVVLKDMGRYYVAVGALLTLAHLSGLTSLDWDDSDFLKLKFGDRRFDILGGQQQWVRFFFQTLGTASRQMLGEEWSGGLQRDNVKTADGKINEAKHDLLSSKGFMLRFLRTKLAPVPSLGWDYLSGSDVLGNEFTWGRALSSRMAPIFYQDVYSAIRQDGLLGIPMSIPGAIGVGYHNYQESREQPGTPAELLARKVQMMTMPDTAMQEEDKLINQRVADIRVRARSGQNVAPELSEMVKSGQISTKRAQSIINGFDDSYFESKVKRLPTEVLKQIRKVANDSERALLDDILRYREVSDKKKEINDVKRGLKAPKIDPYQRK